MIRDICFKSREYVQLEAAEGREYVALSSADLNGDGIAEIIAFSLNGDVVVYKDGSVSLSFPGLSVSCVCAVQVLEAGTGTGTASPQPAIYQLYCNGSLNITMLRAHSTDGGNNNPVLEVESSKTLPGFPRNANAMKSLSLRHGTQILLVGAGNEMHVYTHNSDKTDFEKLTTVELESDVNSVDLVDEHFLLLGLFSGSILLFDVSIETVVDTSGAPEGGAVEESTQEPVAVVSAAEPVKKLALRRILVQPGYEPPLSLINTSGSYSESFIKGYISTEALVPMYNEKGLSARSMDSAESHVTRDAPTGAHFVVAWADGRICLCDIIPSDEELEFDAECTPVPAVDVSAKYVWKAVRGVQTGLCLFNIKCVHLQKHVSYDVENTLISGEDVLCIVGARTGQTFFVSMSDYSDGRADCTAGETPENQFLPPTVCCFDSSALLGGKPPTASDQESLNRSISEYDVKPIFSKSSSTMIRDFTTCYQIHRTLDDIAVANPVTAEAAVNSARLGASSFGDESSLNSAVLSMVQSDTSMVLESPVLGQVTEIVHIGSEISLIQPTASVDEDVREDEVLSIPAVAEVTHTEPIAPAEVRKQLSLWYLTGDGRLVCVPHIDTQFLSFGAGLSRMRVEGRDIEFIRDTLIQWMIAPEDVPFDYAEELMDLVLEYFKNLADILQDAQKAGPADLKRVVNNKTVAEHMTLYFLNELSVLPTRDIVNFTKDLRDLVDSY